jgi:trk system potassium uptake protein TrkA
LELSGAIKGDARVFLFAAREEDEGTVAELELPEGARVSHLYRDGELVFGDTDLRLRKGDEVVIVTHQEHLADLRSRWAPKAVGRRH